MISDHGRAQRGAALITSLVLLLVMTLLAVSTMRNATLEERMAANSAFRNQAFQATESAITQAIGAAPYGAALSSDNAQEVTVSDGNSMTTQASVRHLAATPADDVCLEGEGSSIGSGHECKPGSATKHLFEITASAEFDNDDDAIDDSVITAGVEYAP